MKEIYNDYTYIVQSCYTCAIAAQTHLSIVPLLNYHKLVAETVL